MGERFQLAEGINVANLDGIAEGYSVQQPDAGHARFVANVSVERLELAVLELASLVNSPGHLIIEKGTHRDEEERLRKTDADPFHCDVFYLDNIAYSAFREIFLRYARFFVHCGGTNAGFGSGKGTDEVFIGSYKVLAIYTHEPGKYVRAFERLRVPACPELKTVWDNFTAEAPGERRVITVAGKTIHDAVDELKKEGLYFAERRED